MEERQVNPFEDNAVPIPVDAELAMAQKRWKNDRMSAQVRERAAHEAIAKAYQERDPKLMPQPTGVELRSPGTGRVQNIYNDGSVRNIYQRAPGFSGRQFRKARKAMKRAAKAEEARVLKPILDQLPVIPNHRHTIGENLVPTCGCTFTPEALAAVRAYVRQAQAEAAGTPLAEEVVNPERQLETQE